MQGLIQKGRRTMNEVVEYLKSCGTFYLATNEGNQPHVRPFGAVCEFEGKLYIVTNNQKKSIPTDAEKSQGGDLRL